MKPNLLKRQMKTIKKTQRQIRAGCSRSRAAAGSEPKAGEIWKFPMNSTRTGRTVWWTRKIKEVYGCEGERWCCWEEPKPDRSSCVPVEVVMEGKLISQNDQDETRHE